MFRAKVNKMIICFLAIFAYPPIRKAASRIGVFLAVGILLNLVHDEAVAYLLHLIFWCTLIGVVLDRRVKN